MCKAILVKVESQETSTKTTFKSFLEDKLNLQFKLTKKVFEKKLQKPFFEEKEWFRGEINIQVLEEIEKDLELQFFYSALLKTKTELKNLEEDTMFVPLRLVLGTPSKEGDVQISEKQWQMLCQFLPKNKKLTLSGGLIRRMSLIESSVGSQLKALQKSFWAYVERI